MLRRYSLLDGYIDLTTFRSCMVCWNPTFCPKETNIKQRVARYCQRKRIKKATRRLNEEIQSSTRIPCCRLSRRILLLGDRTLGTQVLPCPINCLFELCQPRCTVSNINPRFDSFLYDSVEKVTIL